MDRLIKRLLGATPQKYLDHIHRVSEGESIPAGSISTAICGYVETLREDATRMTKRPMCPRCTQGVIDEVKSAEAELALMHEQLNAGARIHAERFPKATVIRP